MKVIVSRQELVTLLGKIQNIVPARPSLPVVANVLIEAVHDQLVFTVTDLTVSAKAYVEAKVLAEGAVALPAKRLFQLIRELTSPQIEIDCASSEVAHLHAGSSHFRIQGMSKEGFPEVAMLRTEPTFSIGAEDLRELLSRAIFAAAREDERHILNGVFMHCSHDVVLCTATDSKRLAQTRISIPGADMQEGNYLIPLKTVDEMIRILEGDKAFVYLMPDRIGLEIGPFILISKLLAGPYPDVADIIPDSKGSPIPLHKEELTSLLRQVSLFASEEGKSARFSFTPGMLQLNAMNGEVGEGKVHMPIHYAGPPLDIAFNPLYFLDIIRHILSELLYFEATDSYSPGLITDSTSARFVLMPMRLDK